MSKSFDPSSLLQGTSFEPNAILRGAQLTIVGANRALQNPGLFTSQHYRQAALAVGAGILIRVAIAVPTIGIRVLLRFICLFSDCDGSTWERDVIDGIHHVENHVLQVPFFLMTLLRYLSPAMDTVFMDSLAWVDQTYVKKHQTEDPNALREMYYPNLRMYDGMHVQREKATGHKTGPSHALRPFLVRMGRKAGISLAVYLATFIPVIGGLVLPAASFVTFNKAVGTPAAVAIFGSSLLLPKRYLVIFLQSYYSSRSLMRDLLEPYFSRIRYSKAQKKEWFRSREGVLYGFALAFFIVLKIPLVGVLIYGIAEASTAYLVTKITEPPPSPEGVGEFMQRDVEWRNKHEFLSVPFAAIDHFNAERKQNQNAKAQQPATLQGRQFS